MQEQEKMKQSETDESTQPKPCETDESTQAQPQAQSQPQAEQADEKSEQTSSAQGVTVLPRVRTAVYVRRQIVMYGTLLLAGLLSAFNMAAFVLPNEFVSGGVSGFALILAYVTEWNAGLWLILFNIPLVIIAFFFISKKLAYKSLVSVVSASLFLWLFGTIENFWTYQPVAETRLLPAAVGGVLGGVSLAIILKNGSTTGGTDVIATLVHQKRADINIAWMILCLDMTSIVVSVFVFGEGVFNIEPLILAIAFKFVSAKVCETILEGIKSGMKFEIVTTHPEEVSQEIIQKLHRGVTKIEAMGMYSHQAKALLVCVIRRRELSALQRIVRSFPDTFCYVSSTSEVLGKFNPSNK